MDCSQCSNYTNLEFISTKQLQSERQTTSMFLGAHYYTFERQYKHADFTAAGESMPDDQSQNETMTRVVCSGTLLFL